MRILKRAGKLFARKAKRSPAKKRAAKPRKKKAEKPVGRVTHYYRKIKVAIVKFRVPVREGEVVRFRGATTDFPQALSSLQYDHKPIARASKVKLIGVKVRSRVRAGDLLYRES